MRNVFDPPLSSAWAQNAGSCGFAGGLNFGFRLLGGVTGGKLTTSSYEGGVSSAFMAKSFSSADSTWPLCSILGVGTFKIHSILVQKSLNAGNMTARHSLYILR